MIRFLRPDLYLTVLDVENADFKDSAREFLDRADAVIVHRTDSAPKWNAVSLKPVQARPFFQIEPPEYVTAEIVEFVRNKLLLRQPALT